MLNIKEMISNHINDDTKDILIDYHTTMTSLRPNSVFGLSLMNGNIRLTNWDESQGIPPTTQEINNEYHRQQGIKEFYNYLKNERPDVFELLMTKR